MQRLVEEFHARVRDHAEIMDTMVANDLMMQMLAAGGLDVLSDGMEQAIRVCVTRQMQHL